MRALLRAEWLRFRKRRALQIIIVAVPILATFFFVTSYRTEVSNLYVFDEALERQSLIDQGMTEGLPPDQAEEQIRQILDSEREQFAQQTELTKTRMSGYAFPQSLLAILANATFAFFALMLLTATTLGDEFEWGTIRTALLASSDRRRWLLARFGALAVAGAILFGLLLALGTILPSILGLTGTPPPAAAPLDAGYLGVLFAADVIISIVLIAFAGMATLLVRRGGLTLVFALVWLAVESALLALLLRFAPFQEHGDLTWVLSFFPVRAIVTVLDTLLRSAGRVELYPGDIVTRSPEAAWLPLGVLIAWGLLFAGVAYWRFRRMDIVE
jgi:ABC-type transport system involved in multi-copper enzyme maturation permease subunit